MSKHRKQPRGAALLFVVIILAVLAVVGAGIASRAMRGSENAGAKRMYDTSVSCADAARLLLMSGFSTSGMAPTMLPPLNTTVDGRTLATGHYDNIGVSSVVAVSGATAASNFGVTDMSNRIIRAGLGGQLYRFTVVCSGPAATPGGTPRQNEVEFLVRFGL